MPLDTFIRWRAALTLALTRRLQRLTSWVLMPVVWLLLGRLLYLLASRTWVCPPFIRTWMLLVLAPLFGLVVILTFWPRHLRYHWGARSLLFLTLAVALVPPMVRFWPLFQDKLVRGVPFLAVGAPLAWWAHRRSPEKVLACRSVADEERILGAMEARVADIREGREPVLDLGTRRRASEAWTPWKAFLGPDYLLLVSAEGPGWALVDKAKARLDLPREAAGEWIEGLRFRFPGQGLATGFRAPLLGNPVVGRMSAADLARFRAWQGAAPTA